MKQKLLFVFCLMLASGSAALAQSRTVTNDDLKGYRNDRLAAAREYRETYQKLGLSSPAELQMRNEQDLKEMQKLAGELRERHLAQDRLASVNSQLIIRTDERYYTVEPYYYSPYSVLPIFGQPRYSRGQRRNAQPGYFAGGQFWPTPVRTPMPRPRWIRQR